MESKKVKHERLQKILKKSEEDLILAEKQLEEAQVALFNASEKLQIIKLKPIREYLTEALGFNLDQIDDDLIKSVYKIINP